MTTHTDATDITAANHGGNPYSNAAYASVKPRKLSMEGKMKQFLRDHPGTAFTGDHVMACLVLPHQSASARWTEMMQDGFIEAVGSGITALGEVAATCVLVTDPERITLAKKARIARGIAAKEARTSKLRIPSVQYLINETVMLNFDSPCTISYEEQGVRVTQQNALCLLLSPDRTNFCIEVPKPKTTRKR